MSVNQSAKMVTLRFSKDCVVQEITTSTDSTEEDSLKKGSVKCCEDNGFTNKQISERNNITQIKSDHSYTVNLSSLTAGMTTCPTCGVWVSKVRLGQHTQRQHTLKHTGRNYQCIQCGKLSKCKEALLVHISKYHRTLPLKQSIWLTKNEKQECVKMCEVRNSVSRRIAKSVSVPCSKDKRDNKELKCNDRRPHPKASVFCPKCQYYFPLNHLRMKHPEICQATLHKCQLCDKQFLSQAENVKHLETEHSCPICKTIFSSRKGIEAHVREMHKDIECILAGRRTHNIKRPEHLTESSDDDLSEAELYLDTLCGKCGSQYKKLRLHKQVCQIRPSETPCYLE